MSLRISWALSVEFSELHIGSQWRNTGCKTPGHLRIGDDLGRINLCTVQQRPYRPPQQDDYVRCMCRMELYAAMSKKVTSYKVVIYARDIYTLMRGCTTSSIFFRTWSPSQHTSNACHSSPQGGTGLQNTKWVRLATHVTLFQCGSSIQSEPSAPQA